jgi:hypothetical protein
MRDGDATFTPRIPDFISILESILAHGEKGKYDPLRIRAMETLVSLTTVAGIDTVSIPLDYLGMRRFQIVASPNYELKYLTPAQMDNQFPDITISGQPRYYTIEAGNFRLAPIPDAVYPINCLYYAQFPSLLLGINWLITNHPGIYLYGTLVQATPYIANDERTAVWESKFVAMLNGLQESDDANEHSAGYALQVRSDGYIT